MTTHEKPGPKEANAPHVTSVTAEVKLEARNRLTIRDAGYEHYHGQEIEDGTVVLDPRVLVSPNVLTAETLRKAEVGWDLEEFETAEELFQDLES